MIQRLIIEYRLMVALLYTELKTLTVKNIQLFV